MARPRIRSIRPELWQWEKFGRLSPELQRLALGVVTMADDEGRLRNLPYAIIGHVMPYKRISARKIESNLATLERAGILSRYHVDGEELIQIAGWTDKAHPLYQHINRLTDSLLPPIPSGQVSPDQGLFFTEGSLRPHGGREGMGKDGMGKLLPNPPLAEEGASNGT